MATVRKAQLLGHMQVKGYVMREIRPIAGDQAGILTQAMGLVRDVFNEFEAPEYPPEGVREFMDYIQPNAMAARIRRGGLLVWGLWQCGALAGVLALRPPGHISLLFVHKAYHRQGMARALFIVARTRALQAGAAEMLVHAAPYALDVYSRFGFTPTGPEVLENGIRYIPMRLPLDLQAYQV